jgi:hypothetical protein
MGSAFIANGEALRKALQKSLSLTLKMKYSNDVVYP